MYERFSAPTTNFIAWVGCVDRLFLLLSISRNHGPMKCDDEEAKWSHKGDVALSLVNLSWIMKGLFKLCDDISLGWLFYGRVLCPLCVRQFFHR